MLRESLNLPKLQLINGRTRWVHIFDEKVEKKTTIRQAVTSLFFQNMMFIINQSASISVSELIF